MPLTINGNTVKNLSGPVSMYIHIPKVDHLKQFPYAPILILFGDIHESNKNYCNPVTNKIFGTEFLKLISDAVGAKPKEAKEAKEAKEEKEPDGKVDFYVEGGDHHNQLDDGYNFKDWPMEQLWKLFSKCYNNPKMPERTISKESECNLIKNIRWQSGDIRFFEKEKSKFNSVEFIKNIIRDQEIYPNDLPLNCGVHINLSLSTEMSVNDIKISTTADEIYNEYVLDGLINKQLKKILLADYKLKGYFLDKIKIYIEAVINKLNKEYGSDIETINSIKESIIRLFKCEKYSQEYYDIVKKLETHIENKDTTIYSNYLRSVRTVLLDIYSLCRTYKIIIKYPTIRSTSIKEECPLINIFYFGNRHIEHINEFFLKDIYTNEYSCEANSENRCLDFSKVYDLDTEIGRLKNYRKRSK